MNNCRCSLYCSPLFLFGRILTYCTALVVIMWVSFNYFGDTYLANICLFGLFSTVYELALCKKVHGKRYFFYILCLIGLFLSGSVMVYESIEVRDCDKLQEVNSDGLR